MYKKNNQLLKPEDVAQMLQVTRKTIITMARDGRIPHFRMGRFYRFDGDEIARWMQQNHHA